MAEPFVHHHRVRYHECDAQGIVFNANWFTFFDVTLTEGSGRRSAPTRR